MSTDADYTSFLDQANQDTNSSSAGASASADKTKTASAKTVTTQDVPVELKNVGETYYVSENDEPFEGVSLEFDGGEEIDEESFSSLISTPASSISTLSVKDFDPRHRYKPVVESVKKAIGSGGQEEPRVFRVETGRATVEYWVVGAKKGGGRVVGVRAKAVES